MFVLTESLAKRVSFTYKNYKGEVAERTIYGERVWWGKTEYHPEPQWLLDGWDYARDAHRTFAMKDMTNIRPAGE